MPKSGSISPITQHSRQSQYSSSTFNTQPGTPRRSRRISSLTLESSNSPITQHSRQSRNNSSISSLTSQSGSISPITQHSRQSHHSSSFSSLTPISGKTRRSRSILSKLNISRGKRRKTRNFGKKKI